MDSNHNNIIKIQLKINRNITDINYMFEDCKTLLSFRDNTVDISNIKSMKNFFIEYNFNSCYEKSDNLN